MTATSVTLTVCAFVAVVVVLLVATALLLFVDSWRR